MFFSSLGKPCPTRAQTLLLVSVFYDVLLLMIKADNFKDNLYKDNIMRFILILTNLMH